MTTQYIENKDFLRENFTVKEFLKAEYENCAFTGCIFTKTDLSGIVFSECVFENCDLSMACLKSTSFRDVRLKDCKLLGLRFDECDNFLLSLHFEDCIVNFSSFYGLQLKGIIFKGCKLEQVDFAETDLKNSSFKNCDLSGANFGNTNLEGSDLHSATNFSIDPEANRVSKAKFSAQNITGLLDRYNIIIK